MSDTALTFGMGILDVDTNDTTLRAEVRENGGGTKIIGVLFGLAFLAVPALFITKRADFAEDEQVLLYILCAGLATIGLLVLWSMTKRKKFEFIEVDRTARELRYGYRTDHEMVVQGHMPFDGITSVRHAQHHVGKGPQGLTALYVEGENATWNGAVINGTGPELDKVVAYIRASLKQS